MFCETQWVEKNNVTEDFQKIYEPLLQCLEIITSTDGWDGNNVIQASELLKSITNSTFIAAFHTIKYFFGFIHRLSLTLQGFECNILKAFQIIGSVKQVLQNVRSNISEIFASVYVSLTDMARLAGLECVAAPHKYGPQTTRNNVPASTTHEHFKRLISIAFLDCSLREFNSRVTTLASQAVLALNIIPAHVEHLTIQTINLIYDQFGADLYSTKTSFEQ